MNKLIKLSLITLLCGSCLAACAHQKAAPAPNSPNTISKTVKKASPQTDFHSYINAKWLKETKLKKNESQIDNLSQIGDRTQETISKLISQLKADYDKLEEGSEEKKLMDFYSQASDFKTRNRLGIEPIKSYLDEIKKVSTMDELSQVLVSMYRKNIRNLLHINVTQDIKNSDKNALYIDPHQLSFSKEDYQGTDEVSLKNQKAFKTYLEKVFSLAGDNEQEAKTKANQVYELEKDLAAAQQPKEKADDFEASYNKKTWDDIKSLAPQLPIDQLTSKLGIDHLPSVILSQPEALKKTNQIYQEKNLEALKALLQYRLIAHYSDYLSEDLIKIKAEYNGVIEGATHIPSHDEVAQAILDDNFSELIGKVYVKHHFPEESKTNILEMVQEIKKTYAKRIQAVDWLSEDTKQKALKKLETMVVKVGYPDKWKDLSNLKIVSTQDGGSLLTNIESIRSLNLEEEMAEADQSYDKSQFGMPAHMVNAFYSPGNNEIVFPAGILQAPLYNPDASPEENLGGIGAVIGHEISHAFDKAGSQFDEKGNLANWWKPEDLEKFKKKVKQAADIYSKLEVAPGYYVNGEISTGEIMADLGGLTVAIDIAKQKGYDTKKVFESYAKAWREVTTKEFAIANINDEHPPAKYRVNNIVNQIDQFYEDFKIKEGDPMYVKPEERLRVW